MSKQSNSIISNTLTLTEKFVAMLPMPPKDYSLKVSDLEEHIKKVFKSEQFPFQQEYKVNYKLECL